MSKDLTVLLYIHDLYNIDKIFIYVDKSLFKIKLSKVCGHDLHDRMIKYTDWIN